MRINAQVLIVDDNENMRTVFGKIVRFLSLEVVGEAENGEDAVALYREKKPDLVLMDVTMPVKTGVEALREIREYDPEAYVIMLTSVADMDTVRECIALGAHSYILKSNPINKIKDKIQEVLNEF